MSDINLEFFPLQELPFDAYSKLLGSHQNYCKEFIPTRWDLDIRTGNVGPIIFWYPVYSPKMFEKADLGIHPLKWLNSYNENNVHYFSEIFESTVKKLDKIYFKKIKTNLLRETVI